MFVDIVRVWFWCRNMERQKNGLKVRRSGVDINWVEIITILYNPKKSPLLVCKKSLYSCSMLLLYMVMWTQSRIKWNTLDILCIAICVTMKTWWDRGIIYMHIGMLFRSFHIHTCVRWLLRIRSFVPFVLSRIHATCGLTIPHRAFISWKLLITMLSVWCSTYPRTAVPMKCLQWIGSQMPKR